MFVWWKNVYLLQRKLNFEMNVCILSCRSIQNDDIKVSEKISVITVKK